MEGKDTRLENKFRSFIDECNLDCCLSELQKLYGNDFEPENNDNAKQPKTATEEGSFCFELATVSSGGEAHRRRGGGDRILEALSNSKETLARTFLRGKSAADLKTLGYFTPYFLRDSELVRCMVQNKFKFHEPDPSRIEKDQYRMKGQLEMLNRFVAISDPVYISVLFLERRDSATDPVVRSLELEKTFRDFAEKDFEFTSEYDALRRRCGEFQVALLDQCSDKDEIQGVLDSAQGGGDKRERTISLDLLHRAIVNDNKEFVTHTYSQLLLNERVYDGVPWLERKSFWLIFLVPVLIMAVFPLVMLFFTIFHVFLGPTHKLSKMVSCPLMKYLTSFSSYTIFLVLLIYSAFQPMSDFLSFSVVDWLIFVWFVGLCVDIVTDVFHQAKQLHKGLRVPWWKAFKLQFSSGWNAIGVLMLLMFLMYHVLWFAGYLGLSKQEIRLLRAGEDPQSGEYRKILISFSFNSFGFLFAFAFMLSFTSVNPYNGPLQYALVEMVKSVFKFALFFGVLFFGFSFSFKKLYLQYTQSKRKFYSRNATYASPASRHQTFSGSLFVTFWALFGEIEMEDFQTHRTYDIIHDTGLTLFGVYNVVTILVALNILIAILNKKYDDVSNDLDVAWKFGRTRTYMKWINKEEPIPPPFNLLSIPLTFLCKMVRLCREDRSCSEDEVQQRKNWKDRCLKNEPEKNVDPERCEALQKLIKRYLKTQKLLESGTEPEKEDAHSQETGAENKNNFTSVTTNI